jgi:hypothetical protein
MNVKISVSNKKTFEKNYSEVINLSNVSVSEDRVAFGVSDVIIIGIYFVFEASMSGLTWDYIKEQILPYLSTLFVKKRKNDIIKVTLKDKDDEYDIEIPEKYRIVDVEIPEKLKIRLEK